MPRISNEERAVRQVIDDPNAVITRITLGQDGKKFRVTTSSGQNLFCRVKKEGTSQELPYQEAEVLRQVDSSHVVRPTKIDKIGDNYVVVRPFIEGETLRDRLQRGQMSPEEIRNLADALLDVVESMDTVGAVHFDIKPENIVVSNNGEYYLIDFGAAKFIKKIRTERIHPARKFIPPEVLKYLFEPTELALQRLSTLSDMYGVGAVLYSCITERNISEFFQASSDILQKLPPPVRHFKPAFDPVLSELVDRLLSKEPARRVRAEDARSILTGSPAPMFEVPSYLLKTKPGRGSEHKSVLDAIAQGGRETGVYWFSGNAPRFPKKTLPHNIMWETPVREEVEDLKDDLLRQYRKGVFALCVPGTEIETPMDPQLLRKNLDLIDTAIEWRRNNATHLPLFVLVALENALLNSSEISAVKDAYAAKGVDGIILRVYVQDRRTTFDRRHLKAIAEFIEPWADNERVVLFDGDLSAIPLSAFGVSGLISSTYPRLGILPSRATTPSFAVRPDGIYIKTFLSIISPDNTVSLRGSQLGRTLTNCSCSYCATNFMRRNRLAQWVRKDRRKHFIHVIPKEIEAIRTGGIHTLQQRIHQAQIEANRFSGLIRINLPHLQVWQDFLSNS